MLTYKYDDRKIILKAKHQRKPCNVVIPAKGPAGVITIKQNIKRKGRKR